MRASHLGALAVAGLTALGMVQPVSAATLYNTNVLLRSPVVYLQMDDTTGTVATDSTPNGFSGTYNAGDTLGQPAASSQLGTSILGPALAHNNAAIPVKLNSSGVITALNNIGTGDVSIQFWFNTSATDLSSQREDLFDFRAASATDSNGKLLDFGITLGADSGFGRLSVFHTAGAQIKSSGADNPLITANAWHLVTVTRNGTTGEEKLYLDGLNVGPTATDTQPFATDSGGVVALGNKTTGSAHLMLGNFDDFAIYSSVLSPADVAGDYVLGSTGTVPEPASLGLLLGGAALLLRRRREMQVN